MNGVQAGHDKVEPEKELRLRLTHHRVVWAGDQMVCEVFVVFEAFEREKGKPKDQRYCQVAEQSFGATELCRLDSQGHGQAAREQDACVQCAEQEIGMTAGQRKLMRICMP